VRRWRQAVLRFDFHSLPKRYLDQSATGGDQLWVWLVSRFFGIIGRSRRKVPSTVFRRGSGKQPRLFIAGPASIWPTGVVASAQIFLG
jgi:hypothetical protein